MATTHRNPRLLVICALVALSGYFLSYLYFRSAWQETWPKDQREYVLFPQKPILIYYAYRPLSLIDGRVTGMRFHIGPHAE